MRVAIRYGQREVEVEVADQRLLSLHGTPAVPALADPAAAVDAALETPLGFPSLRQALTPDDRVAIVVDESLPRLPELLLPILRHIRRAQVALSATTLLCSPTSSSQDWLEELPEDYQEVRVEVHDPGDRRRLAYLATTRQGRRIYLNRTLVDADQLVVLTRRTFAGAQGHAGCEGALYPAFSDSSTRAALTGSWPRAGVESASARREAAEVAWLLGAPFFVQVIAGSGDDIVHVLGGLADSGSAGDRLLAARWRKTVERPADVVIATLTGNRRRHDFATLARALHTAAEVVRPGGRIALLCQAAPALGPVGEFLREADNPAEALARLRQQPPPDHAAVEAWISAAEKAQVYLLSDWPAEIVEELFAIPLQHAGQIERLFRRDDFVLILPDADQLLVTLQPA
ncbi:MAG: lactate racemase domain-containing protein [Gemmataceae bacterium]|nr:lactate racemase domain-containing protein [Gemmataceae bacterium]MDW8266811.1 lactate racemase domain-containing protein [Gemmataceae bacterium]